MKSLFVAALIFMWIPVIFFKPHIGVLVWSWVSHMIPQSYVYGFASTFPFLVVVGVLTAGGAALSKEKMKLPAHPIIIAILIYAAWTLITLALAFEPSVGEDKAVQFMKMIVFAMLSTMIMQTPHRLKMFLYVMMVSLLFIAVKGGIFTALTGGSARVQGAGGMMGDNNQLAMALSMLFPLSVYLAQYPPIKILRWPLIGAALLVPFAVIGTQSRGGLVALLATFGMFAMKSRYRFRIVIVAIPLAIAAVNFMPQSWIDRMQSTENATDDNSFLGRVSMWKFATNVASDHPVEGGGFDVFYVRYLAPIYMPSGYKARAPHSIYFEVLGEHGYVGLFLFMTMLFSGWYAGGTNKKLFLQYNETRWLGDLSGALQISFVAFAVGGLTVNIAAFDFFYHLLITVVLCRVVGDKLMEKGVTPFGTANTDEGQKSIVRPTTSNIGKNGKWAPSRPVAGTTPAQRRF